MNNEDNNVFSFGSVNADENLTDLNKLSNNDYESSNIFSQSTDSFDSSIEDMNNNQEDLSFTNEFSNAEADENNVIDLNNIGDSSDFARPDDVPAVQPVETDNSDNQELNVSSSNDDIFEVYPFENEANKSGLDIFESNPFSGDVNNVNETPNSDSEGTVLNNEETDDLSQVDLVQEDNSLDLEENANKVPSVELFTPTEESKDENSKTSLERDISNYNEKTDDLSQVGFEQEDNSLDLEESNSGDEYFENNIPPVVELLPDNDIEISDTPIEEINKLAEYEEDEVDSTDIDSIFDKISVNVREASDIFKKNTDIKKKIDKRFKDLEQLQIELESKRKAQIEEIDSYKNEVFEKLTQKKQEIEERLNLLKDEQAKQQKEKEEFEEYKKSEYENIEKIKNEIQSAYDERREELSNVEDALRKQREILDEERNQLSLDKIEYESEKNELANNLLKFNELVDEFTNGVKVDNG